MRTFGQVALIELDDERHLPDLEAVGLQVLAQVDEGRGVVLGLGELRIGDERNRRPRPAEPSLRVEPWMTCPGTVKSLMRMEISFSA